MLKYLKIDLDGIRHNVKQIKSKLNKGAGLMAIVKSDAYGHGALEVAKSISSKVIFFGVDDFVEAKELRKGGIRKPILILGAFERGDLGEIAQLDISIPIYSKESLKMALGLKKSLKVHLKVDTGMHRLGVEPEEAVEFARKIEKNSNLELEGLWSHFADSGERLNDSYSKRQIKIFNKVLASLGRRDIKPKFIHLSNSSGIIRFKSAQYNLVRSGVMIYGLSSTQENKDIKLKPAIEFISQIVQIRDLKKGEPVGYGLTYSLSRNSQIAVLPVGYKDGYPRQLSSKGEVLVGGQRCSIVGRICMRMMMIDISEINNSKVGDEVVLIGGQQSDRIGVDEIADKIDTNKHEIISRLDKQLIRVYE